MYTRIREGAGWVKNTQLATKGGVLCMVVFFSTNEVCLEIKLCIIKKIRTN